MSAFGYCSSGLHGKWPVVMRGANWSFSKNGKRLVTPCTRYCDGKELNVWVRADETS